MIAPHDIPAQRGILGALLQEPDESIAMVLDSLAAEDFFLESHRLIYEAVRTLYGDAAGVSRVTVADLLVQRGQMELAGGAAHLELLELDAHILSAMPKLVEIVRLHGAARRAIQQCLTAVDKLGRANGSASTVITELAEEFGRLADRALADQQEAPEESLGAVAGRVLVDLAMTLPEHVGWPVAGLNHLLGGGSLRGELVYLAGPSGGAKTACALWFGDYAAQQGRKVVFVSAEQTREAIARRALTQRAMVAAGAFRSGTLSEPETERALRVVPLLEALPFIIDDRAVTLGAIRRLVRRHAPDLLIVDYLQLLQGPRSPDKREEVDALSRGLKRLAKRHHCVVLVLSQVTLQPNGRGGFHRPTMFSLKESRGPSADADTIMILWRPDKDQQALELIVDKGRDHATGTIAMTFTPTYLLFQETSTDG